MNEQPCPHCGRNHPEGAKFCPLTGKSLEVTPPRCPSCGEAVELGWIVCAYCGHRLGSSATAAPAKRLVSYPAERPLSSKIESVPKTRRTTERNWAIGLAVLVVIILALWYQSTLDDPLSGSGIFPGRESKPDHYGVYLKENNRLTEIVQQEGSPGRSAKAGTISTSFNLPTLLVWDPGLDLQNLYLVSEGGEGQEVVYVTTPKENGILELRPRVQLQLGHYCLIQADPLGVSYFFPNWCFIIN